MAAITLPPQSYVAWKVAILLVHGVAVTSTIYRLVHRFRIRRAWWDDYLVILPLIMDILYCILTWVRLPHRYVLPLFLSKSMEVLNSVWLSLFPYLLVVWPARMTLALSLARIFPDKHPARIWSLFLVAIMFIACICSMVVGTLTCRYSSSLKSLLDATSCAAGAGGFPLQALLLISGNLASDSVLIISPLVFFWRIGLPSMERRLVLVLCCASILTLMTASSIAIIFLNKGIWPGTDDLLILVGMFNIESAVCLTVCNLTVVSTCLYQAIRRARHWESFDQEDTTQYHSRPCTCISDSGTALTSVTNPMTLTEISSFPSSARSGYEDWTDPSSTTPHDSAFLQSEKSEI